MKINWLFYNQALNNSKVIANISRQIEVEELEREVEVALKEKEISNLKVNSQTILLIFSLLFILLTIVLMSLLYKRYLTKQKLNTGLEEKIQLQKQERKNELLLSQFQNEIKLLRAQINPHFLFESHNYKYYLAN